jgi:hypothetical protein
MHEILEPIIIDFQAFNRQLALERVRIELPHFVVINVKFFQLFQILQTIDLYYLVSRCL